VTSPTLDRRVDDLVLQLKGLVHVRAILELRGASRAELDAHAREADRVRAELARVAKAQATGSPGRSRSRWSRTLKSSLPNRSGLTPAASSTSR
jgi:hypothetical protein